MWLFSNQIHSIFEFPTMILGKTEGTKRMGRQKMRWLDYITDIMKKIVWTPGDSRRLEGLAYCGTWVMKSRMRLNDWTTVTKRRRTSCSHFIFDSSPVLGSASANSKGPEIKNGIDSARNCYTNPGCLTVKWAIIASPDGVTCNWGHFIKFHLERFLNFLFLEALPLGYHHLQDLELSPSAGSSFSVIKSRRPQNEGKLRTRLIAQSTTRICICPVPVEPSEVLQKWIFPSWGLTTHSENLVFIPKKVVAESRCTFCSSAVFFL